MDVKELAIVFFYPAIREMVEKFLPEAVEGLVDFILLIIGYIKRNTWWGRGLVYGAVASLGATYGRALVRSVTEAAKA